MMWRRASRGFEEGVIVEAPELIGEGSSPSPFSLVVDMMTVGCDDRIGEAIGKSLAEGRFVVSGLLMVQKLETGDLMKKS